jgi:hypothetical protein
LGHAPTPFGRFQALRPRLGPEGPGLLLREGRGGGPSRAQRLGEDHAFEAHGGATEAHPGAGGAAGKGPTPFQPPGLPPPPHRPGAPPLRPGLPRPGRGLCGGPAPLRPAGGASPPGLFQRHEKAPGPGPPPPPLSRGLASGRAGDRLGRRGTGAPPGGPTGGPGERAGWSWPPHDRALAERVADRGPRRWGGREAPGAGVASGPAGPPPGGAGPLGPPFPPGLLRRDALHHGPGPGAGGGPPCAGRPPGSCGWPWPS